MRTFVLVALLLAVVAALAAAESPYVRSGSVGVPDESPPKPCADGDFVFRPVRCWIGERLVFLPAQRIVQMYGYQEFHPVGGDRFEHPGYEELVGTVVEVVDVSWEDERWRVTAQTDSGDMYFADAWHGDGSGEHAILRSVALLADLEAARRHYLGKQFWLLDPVLQTHDALTDRVDYFTRDTRTPVEIVDIVLGWYEDRPIRVIVRTADGREGFRDVRVSDSNTRAGAIDADLFGTKFASQPPEGARINPEWPENVRKAVAARKVFVGMTEEQARCGWGEPASINRTTTALVKSEQWVYSSGSYLYFEDGVLVAIQN